jgi:hypothetical protein
MLIFLVFLIVIEGERMDKLIYNYAFRTKGKLRRRRRVQRQGSDKEEGGYEDEWGILEVAGYIPIDDKKFLRKNKIFRFL